MLAEGRKNHSQGSWKNWSLNPRGVDWGKDEQNLGHKLMKKMGWSSGDGLGKNGTGIKAPIKVSSNEDCTGLGFKRHQVDNDNSWNWLSHQDDFNSLLCNLQEQHTSASTDEKHSDSQMAVAAGPLAMEKRSKGSRRRVHYHRAIQGKDMSKRSVTDWECVLGPKKKRKRELTPEINDAETETAETVTSRINSQEYFLGKRFKVQAINKEEQVIPLLEIASANVSSPRDGATEQATPSPKSSKKKQKKRRKKRERASEDSKPVEDLTTVFKVLGLEKENIQHQDSLLVVRKKKRRPGKVHYDLGADDSLIMIRKKKQNSRKLVADDSLLVIRKKKKKKRKVKNSVSLQRTSDLNGFHQCQTSDLESNKNPFFGSKDSQNVSLDASSFVEEDSLTGELICESNGGVRKRSVRFNDEPTISYVPRCDVVRGGAWWYWKKYCYVDYLELLRNEDKLLRNCTE